MVIADILIFYILKLLIIIFAVLVVTIRNPIQSVLLLVAVYLFSAMELFFLEVEFLAFIYITLYVGAVTILFLFVVMLIDIQPSDDSIIKPYYLTGVILFLSIFGLELGLQFSQTFSLYNVISTTDYIQDLPSFHLIKLLESPSHTHLIGIYIFTLGAFPLFILGFVLLVALIGPILLTLSHDRSHRRQLIHEQNSAAVSTSILLFSKKNL